MVVVSIGLSAGAVASVRFTVSGLWEVLASLRVLRDTGDHAIHLPWVRRVREPLIEAGLIGPRAGLLWQLVAAAPGYVPDFLTPPAAGLTPDLESELEVVRNTPPATVRAELDLLTGSRLRAVRDLYADPAAGLHRIADEIVDYWRIALAADWPRIRMVLEAEVYHRARRLAEDGTSGLLNDLHDRVRWESDTLSINQRHCSAADVPAGEGLVLIPSVFVWPSVLSVAAGAVPQLAYPARGAATLWERPPDPPAALAAVIGRGRARLLAEMRTPVSTTELARRTGISAGGVSQHLGVLRAAGLVVTHRSGRTVLNARTAVADALLSAAP